MNKIYSIYILHVIIWKTKTHVWEHKIVREFLGDLDAIL